MSPERLPVASGSLVGPWRDTLVLASVHNDLLVNLADLVANGSVVFGVLLVHSRD